MSLGQSQPVPKSNTQLDPSIAIPHWQVGRAIVICPDESAVFKRIFPCQAPLFQV